MVISVLLSDISANAGASFDRRADAVDMHFINGIDSRVSPFRTGAVVTKPRPLPKTVARRTEPMTGVDPDWASSSESSDSNPIESSLSYGALGGSFTHRSNSRSRFSVSPRAPSRPRGTVWTPTPGFGVNDDPSFNPSGTCAPSPCVALSAFGNKFGNARSSTDRLCSGVRLAGFTSEGATARGATAARSRKSATRPPPREVRHLRGGINEASVASRVRPIGRAPTNGTAWASDE